MSTAAVKESLLLHTINPLDVVSSGLSTPSVLTVSPTGAEYQPSKAYTSFSDESLFRYMVKTIGCPKEIVAREKRVAQTPESVKMLIKKGYTVLIESGSGIEANIPDSLYEAAGAEIVSKEKVWKTDAIVKVRPPVESEIKLMKKGTILFSFLYPGQNEKVLQKLIDQGVTVFAMDCVPRVSRAQAFDALSSMANIAGYKAVVEAAHHFGRFFSGQITAAGRVPPAKVLVIGGGVAGLSAIATAKNMAAIVSCFDTRPAVKEQVESLGAEFLEVKGIKLEEGVGGYAKEMSKEFIEAEMALFRAQAKEVDVIITTALIPGKKAPILITKDMIESMKYGSVVVDLAAEMGGNIETTRKDEIYVSSGGVTHIGLTDLPSCLPTQSSRLYSNNITKLFLSLTDKTSTDLVVDLTDEVTRGCIVTTQGKLYWPPPKTIGPPPVQSVRKVVKVDKPETPPFRAALYKSLGVTIGILTLLAINVFDTETSFLSLITTFCLAGIAGYQAVWGVVPSLHTPLMSVTNAISGTTAIGALLVIGPGSTYTQALVYIALCASCINIVGGFKVTMRMLDMFRRPTDPPDYSYLYGIPMLALVIVYALSKLFRGSIHIKTMTYLAASICCIVAIGGLSSQKTSRFGNSVGIIGVFTGLLITWGGRHFDTTTLAIVTGIMCLGGIIGHIIGKKVQVTDLPQTVAAFHSFVGLAAMLTSIAHYLQEYQLHPESIAFSTTVGAIIGDFIGGITFTGSIVAFGKLHGVWRTKALHLPGKNYINISLVTVQILTILLFVHPLAIYASISYFQTFLLCLTAAIALFLGWHLVDSIGGGDMPVCITVLNSYSGWALVAEGFMLHHTMLIIVGSLIGFSGGILSYIMCIAMNRSLANVLFGGYATAAPGTKKEFREHQETTADETVELILSASTLKIVPGYGMAVAKAQYAIADLARLCRSKNIDVKFIIHPVAGRMPGQMNVLLAEAGVPYDWVYEMEEVNDEFSSTDVTLVIGANDITNSAAIEDPTCAIAGMPVLHVWAAKNCIFMKRTMGSGYADLDNPVFYKDNTLMLLGDAKSTVETLVSKIKTYCEP